MLEAGKSYEPAQETLEVFATVLATGIGAAANGVEQLSCAQGLGQLPCGIEVSAVQAERECGVEHLLHVAEQPGLELLRLEATTE